MKNMEFKSLTNIESGFRHLRSFSIVFLAACVAVSGYAVWKAYDFAEMQRRKIYVLDEGKSLMLALSQDLSQNRPVEAREHVRRFHELFFTLAPDKAAIEDNIRRALFLSDKIAFGHYRDLVEKGYYNRIISGNINQRIMIDSIVCDFDTYPYPVATYARQFIIREKSVTQRKLVTRSRLRNSVRSDNNPHGFILEGFDVVDNRDLGTTDR
jgi:conjugative transposon TraK protein